MIKSAQILIYISLLIATPSLTLASIGMGYGTKPAATRTNSGNNIIEPVENESKPDRRTIDTIIIHHSATESGTVESIRRFHVGQRGWDDIGYHYLITPDGIVHAGRDPERIGAHAKGRNLNSLGICLIGTDTFSHAQLKALAQTVAILKHQYPITKIERHHAECPGNGISISNL